MIVKFEADYTTNNQLLYKHYSFAMDICEDEHDNFTIWESAVYHALVYLNSGKNSDIVALSSITLIRD